MRSAARRPAGSRRWFPISATPARTASPPAHADLGQAGRQPDRAGRRRPRPDARPARRPDPGLLRYSDRQPLCRTRDGARHQVQQEQVLRLEGHAWCRRTSAAWCARARLPSASVRRWPSSTSAARSPGESEVMNIIGEVTASRASWSTTSSIPAARLCNAAEALLEKGADVSPPTSPTACCRAARWRASPRPSSSELVHHRLDPADRSRDSAPRNIRVMSWRPDRRGNPAHRARRIGFQPV
jgi:hypothetical protein